MDQMLMAHPRIYSKAFAQGSSHAAKWKAVSVSQDKLYIYVSAWWLYPLCGRLLALQHFCKGLVAVHPHGACKRSATGGSLGVPTLQSAC